MYFYFVPLKQDLYMQLHFNECFKNTDEQKWVQSCAGVNFGLETAHIA